MTLQGVGWILLIGGALIINHRIGAWIAVGLGILVLIADFAEFSGWIKK